MSRNIGRLGFGLDGDIVITGPAAGGTVNTVCKFTAGFVIGDSSIVDDGTDIEMGSKWSCNVSEGYQAIGTTTPVNTTGLALTGALNGLTGVSQFGISIAYTPNASATTAMYGLFTNINTPNSVFTTTNFYNLYVSDPNKGAAHTITNHYGLYIENMTVGTNDWAIYTNTGTVRFGDNVDMVTAKYIGLGSAAGRIVFTDAATDTIAFQNCNVGIGGTPTSLFHIMDSTANSTPRWRIENDVQAYDFTCWGGNADQFLITDETAGEMRVLINTSGYVGIGNQIVPAEKLDVYNGHVAIDDGYSFGLGSSAGRIVFNNLATDSAVFTSCHVGINVAPSTLLHIDQSSTTLALPVVILDQGDVDEPFIQYIGTAAAADLTRNIVAVGDVTTATLQGYIKIEVQDDGNQITDQDYFQPIYTLA